MMEEIFRTIEEYRMIEAGMRLIVGVSGGADSVCLLYVLGEYQKRVPFEFRVVHVDHGLRGEESQKDAAFVEQLCEDRGIPCEIVKSEVRTVAEKEGISLEEAGRSERYRIFEEKRRDWDADRIAVAHNRNDQAETVLLNLARGSGLKGLAGIRPVRDRIIRPLLFTRRDEIEKILKEAKLNWRTDRSNLKTDYARNRVRLELIPLMEKELNSQAQAHIAQTADRMRELNSYLDRQTDAAAKRCILDGKDGIILLTGPFSEEDTLIQNELLLRALELCAGKIGRQPGSGRKDIAGVHLEMLRELSRKDCGKCCDLPGGISACREKDALRFYARGADASPQPLSYALPVPGRLELAGLCVSTELMTPKPGMEEEIREEKKYTKWLSYDTIKNGLQLRTRQSGDYLVVNSEGGKKKLRDYLIDLKIPRRKRDGLLLLADGSRILWVLGYRIGEDCKVTEKTEKLLKITVSGLDGGKA